MKKEEKEMYFAEMSCDELTENTVAFQISTINPEIAPQYSFSSEMYKRLVFPKQVNSPRGFFVAKRPYMENFCRDNHLESMCTALLPEEHPFDTVELGRKLLKVVTTESIVNEIKLVAVTVIDGRLCFRLWEPEGFVVAKVLPTELKGSDCFDFGLQLTPYSKDGVRIAYMRLDEERHQFAIERYHRGEHNEILTAKSIVYRSIQGNTKVPHFRGYMETLTVR